MAVPLRERCVLCGMHAGGERVSGNGSLSPSPSWVMGIEALVNFMHVLVSGRNVSEVQGERGERDERREGEEKVNGIHPSFCIYAQKCLFLLLSSFSCLPRLSCRC